MEPGVPFALLGAVQIMLAASLTGLAGAAALRRSVPGALVALGAVALAAVEVRTALQLGTASSDDLALLRAAASLVLAVGLFIGGVGPRRLPGSTYGVVIPLGATGGPAVFAAGASLVAALAAVVDRRDRVGLALGSSFALLAAAAAVSPSADTSAGAATTVLALRGAAALLLLLGLAVLAQASLLSKVVTAILAGVLAMAVAAVGVVGNVVVSSYDRQTREVVEQAAEGRSSAIDSLGQQAANQAAALDLLCRPERGPGFCQGFVQQFVVDRKDDFVVAVNRGGSVQSYGGRAPLRGSELLGLSTLSVVRGVLDSRGAQRTDALFGVVQLAGSRPGLAVVGVGVSEATPRVGGAQGPASRVLVYGHRLDDDYARRDLETGGFGLTLVAGDPLQVVATNRSDNLSASVLSIALRSGGVSVQPRTVGSQGTAPTVRLVPLLDERGSAAGLLAVSRDPGPALKTERDALRLLLVTALLALLLVGLGATVLGRRTVEPVRQLTAAAERVAAGDLTATADVRTRDEVGTLSATFDAMTSSLGQLTGDLRDSAARLGTVLASMSDGLLATDADGVVTAVNPAALEMLGLEESDVLGEELGVVADVRDAASAQLADPALRLRDVDAEVHRPDGTTVPVRVELGPLQGASAAAGVVLVLRDTTREREVERMKTEFLSNVSHELRTPLTPIRGYAEILVSKPGLDEGKVLTFATTIRDEALKMNRVVDLLVDVAALEAGRVSVSPRPVSVKDLLDVRLDAWQARAPQRKADLKRRVAGGLPLVHVDPTWVGKALDELIDNAVKYTPVGAAITLVGGWSPDRTRVRIAVKDAGPGIAEEDQGSLFTSFEQVDGSATRKVGGLGLGLSFVRRLADDAGYPLTVTSRLGKGSEFALDLPVSPRA